MNFDCKLVKKAFTTNDGKEQEYFVLQLILADGSSLDVPIKSDKARLLVMSYNLTKNK